MKKIYLLFISSCLLLTFISSTFYSVDWNNNFLQSLPDFDWSKIDKGNNLIGGGDGTTYSYKYNANGDIVSNSVSKYDLGTIKPDNINSVINYENTNTGYQYYESIYKQAVTGVPLSKNYNFNGNSYSDYGVNNNSRKYMYKNSILNWDDNNDIDSKYLASTVPLQKCSKVASGAEGNQDEKINFTYLGDPAIVHRSYNSNIVGKYNPYEKTSLNWQYVSDYVNWGGSWYEGMVEIPNVGLTEEAHMNGKQIFGTIFFSGYNGLTKDQLRDFVQKDSSGNYKIVDILIKMCKYYGFDGYFINNESNGVKPNGTVLDYNVLLDIVKQFNEKVAKSNDSEISNYKIKYYNSYATLGHNQLGYTNKETYLATKTSLTKTNDSSSYVKPDICLDFGDKADASEYFLKSSDNYAGYTGSDIYNIVDMSYNNNMIGSYDYRYLSYENGKNSNDDYKYNSIVSFSGGGATNYSETVRKNSSELSKRLNSNDISEQVKGYTYLQEVNNLYEGAMFNGTNLRSGDNNSGKNSSDLTDIRSTNYNLDYVYNDPRIEYKYGINEQKGDDLVKQKVYDYSDSQNNTSSYGVSDLIVPTTVITDEYSKKLDFSTDFSTGNGINYYYIDSDGNQHSAADGNENYYPWTNQRIQDVLPTYQWKIYKCDSNANIENGDNGFISIKDMNGFYDYYDAYEKGNSIALGSSFDKDGKINDATWSTNDSYLWDIFGTNLSNNNYEVSIVYKDGDSDSDISLVAESTNQSTYSSKNNIINGTITKLDNGWKKLSCNLSELSGINNSNKISKLGLMIKPKSSNFKINVGKFSISNSSSALKKVSNKNIVNNPKSEYVIKRSDKNINVRFSWDVDSNDAKKVSMYQIYYIKTVNGKKEYSLAGETTNTLYYLKNLSSQDGKVEIGILPYNKDYKAYSISEFSVEVN